MVARMLKIVYAMMRIGGFGLLGCGEGFDDGRVFRGGEGRKLGGKRGGGGIMGEDRVEDGMENGDGDWGLGMGVEDMVADMG